MAVAAKPADSVPEGWRRFLVPLGALGGLILIVVGVVVMKDPLAGQHMLANIYDLLGNAAGAEQLRNNQGDVFVAKMLLAVIALIVGVGGIWMLYTGVSAIVGLTSPRWQQRILPWVFVVPAILLLTVFLVYPTISTFITSFTDGTGGDPLANYALMLKTEFLNILRNNVIWLVVATAGSVGLGLLVAGLVDRVRREALAKTFVFLPLAISLVGASVIWRFVYAWQPPGLTQYGLLNAGVTAAGLQPVPWVTTSGFPINTLALIVIMIWLQTGFAMVVLSAAIKGVSVEVLEAARLDGASERQIFLGIVVPIIKGSIITVATTIAIAVLKIFDIVFVMTGGRFDTDVVANRMYVEMFQFGNSGRAAALASILFLAVLPIMFVNVRNLRKQGIGS